MKVFRFQKFEVQQSKEVFRVGTDAVLLGVLCRIDDVEKVLEVGTGTGIISLMLAQRNLKSEFLAVDIAEEAIELAHSNFQNSPFSKRIKAVHIDFNLFENHEKFDLIVSNPPYFEASGSEKDKIARQMVLLNFEQLISKSSQLLNDDGRLSIVVPYDVALKLNTIAKNYGLYLERQVTVFGIEGGEAKRVVLEYSKKEKITTHENFVIERAPRQYSEQYIEATKDFHIFKYN